jgi:hypothetical protein
MKKSISFVFVVSALALASCCTTKNSTLVTATPDYTVKSHVKRTGQGYYYEWTVHNKNQSRGLDHFAVEVPIETQVLAHTMPSPYANPHGTAYWEMLQTQTAQVDAHDGNAWLPAAQPGKKWILWSGRQPASVYPPGSTAKFSVTTDASVIPGTVPETVTIYTPWNRPHFYLSFDGEGIGPSVLGVSAGRPNTTLEPTPTAP